MADGSLAQPRVCDTLWYVWESAVNQVCLYFFCFLSNPGAELTTCSSRKGILPNPVHHLPSETSPEPWELLTARQDQGGETHRPGALLLCSHGL